MVIVNFLDLELNKVHYGIASDTGIICACCGSLFPYDEIKIIGQTSPDNLELEISELYAEKRGVKKVTNIDVKNLTNADLTRLIKDCKAEMERRENEEKQSKWTTICFAISDYESKFGRVECVDSYQEPIGFTTLRQSQPGKISIED